MLCGYFACTYIISVMKKAIHTLFNKSCLHKVGKTPFKHRPPCQESLSFRMHLYASPKFPSLLYYCM